MLQLLKLEHLVNYKKFFLKIITTHYAIPHDLILKYQNLWDWLYLSKNESINWTEELLETLEDKLIWANSGISLNHNRSLPWSARLIEHYIEKGKWIWEDLACQERIFQNPELLAFCLPHWSEKVREKIDTERWDADWDLGAYKPFERIKWGDDAIHWAPAVVENCPNLDWDLFSGVKGFPWTLPFIQKHQDKLNWKRLSANKGMPWSMEFLKMFKDKLDWYWVNCSWKDVYHRYSTFHYTQEILETFEDYIDWKSLTVALDDDFAIKWTPEMLVRFKDKIHWSEPYDEMGNEYISLINHEGIYWTLDLFAELRPAIEAHFEKEKNQDVYTMEKNEQGEKVYWSYYCRTYNWSPQLVEWLYKKQKKEGVLTINWPHLAQYAEHMWSEDFIKKYESELLLNLDDLCENEFFPWNDYFEKWLAHLSDRGWQRLSRNPSLSISPEQIKKYQSKWDWYWLSGRGDLTDSMIETFQEFWDWKRLSSNPSVKPETLFRYADKVDFEMISERKDLTEKNLTPEILERFKDKWKWYQLSKKNSIPLDYLYPYVDRLSLNCILQRDNLKIEDLDLSLPWKWENLGVWLHNDQGITRHLNDELVEDFLREINQSDSKNPMSSRAYRE